jgi:uncharacterized protein (DUF362 family)/Pyruvate/2-oxoacid:ferredoxin oxidoreductase delta subunit
MMPKVLLQRARYDYVPLKTKIFAMMDSLGGRKLIAPQRRVLIKPNLLAPASPERAMLTHPLVVRAVVEYVLEQGAVAQISDSPAMGSLDKVLKASGIKDALQGLRVQYRPFNASLPVEVGEPFHRIEIAEDALQADVLVNLPKLKTHGQMLLTLGVKNLFGCIVGFRKPEWHLRAGVDREMFARLLVHIHRALRPAITILDGILAMEGQGPGISGTPRPLGVLLASDDAVALDMTVCRLLGMPPEQLLTNKISREMGLVSDDLVVEGELPSVRNFKLPDITPLVFGPRAFHGMLRKHLVQRPVVDGAPCRLCGACWSYCPAQAISHDRTRVHFDYDRCIRCYCCLEVCPHGALRAEEPQLGKILRRIRGIASRFR